MFPFCSVSMASEIERDRDMKATKLLSVGLVGLILGCGAPAPKPIDPVEVKKSEDAHAQISKDMAEKYKNGPPRTHQGQ